MAVFMGHSAGDYSQFMRYACVLVPNLAVAVARRDDRTLDGRPVVIVGRAA
jgi:hypothetical protein